MIHDTWSSFSADNLETTEKFYSEVLGMRVKKLQMGILEMHPPGGNKVWIYPKEGHEPATFTVLNFIVDNIDKEADRLNGLGITFERYPGFETDARGIVRSGEGPTIAWFKDPSGNILAIIEEPPAA